MDHAETLLQAIEIVTNNLVSNLPFDKTIVGTITDASNAKNGKYKVKTTDNVVFEATSENSKYEKDQQVFVLIPEGDMSGQKRITGKYIPVEENDSLTYVSPEEQIVKTSVNYAADLPLKKIGKGCYINNSESSWSNTIEIGRIEGNKISSVDQLSSSVMIRAKFKSLLKNYKVISGSYGIGFTVILDEDDEPKVFYLLDSRRDMFGDVYNYSSFTEQTQIYSFNPKHKIKDVIVSLYVNNLVVQNDSNNDGQFSMDFIEVKDIEFYFGYEVVSVPNKTVKIYTPDEIAYSGKNEAIGLSKQVYLTWYNKTENNKYLGFTDGKLASNNNEIEYAKKGDNIPKDKTYYFIEWQIDQKNGSLANIEGKNNKQQVTIECETGLTTTEVKANVYCNGTKYESNVIKFENQDTKNDTLKNLGISISLENVGEGKDVYPFYGEDNELINQSDASTIRKVKFTWSATAGEIKPEYWKGAKVEWSIPKDATMLLPVDKNDDGSYIYEKSVTIDEKVTDSNNYLEYRIKQNFNVNNIYNTIKCKITLNNSSVEAEKTFTFTSKGTFGTNYTLTVAPTDERVFGFTSSGTYNFVANLFDDKGKEIDKSFYWYLYPENTAVIEGVHKNVSVTFGAGQGNKYRALRVFTNHNWLGSNTRLEKIYPIIYSSEGRYYASAPSFIIYDSFGKLQPTITELKLFNYGTNTEIKNGVSWSISYRDYQNEAVTIQNPTGLPTINGNKLVIPGYYIKSDYYAVLYAAINNVTVWQTPLIIQQYQYSSSLLNNWDGSQIVDAENNIILTSAGVFGAKVSNNTFSGVTLGELRKIDTSQNISSETGLIGYKTGKQVYGFKDDGTAFIGGSGLGRINFDGIKGIIASSGWINTNGSIKTSGGTGLKINLQDGQILSDKLTLKATQSNKDILILDSTATNTTPMFQIGSTDSKYIQYLANGQLKINIDSVNLNIGGKTIASFTDEAVDLKVQSIPTGTSQNYIFRSDVENKSTDDISIKYQSTVEADFFDNKDYTFTICVSFTNDLVKTISCMFGSSGQPSLGEHNPTDYSTSRQIFSFTGKGDFNVEEEKKQLIQIFAYDSSKNKVEGLVVHWVKLELENKFTGWSPAPEDGPNTYAQLQITQNQITSEVHSVWETGLGVGKASKASGTAKVIATWTGNEAPASIAVGTIIGVQFNFAGNNDSYKYLIVNNEADIRLKGKNQWSPDVTFSWNENEVVFFQYNEVKKGDGARNRWWYPINNYSSIMTQTAQDISAKVSNQSTGGSCSWTLDPDGFYINQHKTNAGTASKNNYVMKVDESGLEVKGKITATEGKIGNWNIHSTGYLYFSAQKNNEIYGIQLNPIFSAFNSTSTIFAIGKKTGTDWSAANFRVDGNGKLYATDAEITGNITAKTFTLGENASIPINKTTGSIDKSRVPDLTAYYAKIDVIESDYITTSELNAKTISADKITTGNLTQAITMTNGSIILENLSIKKEGIFYGNDKVLGVNAAGSFLHASGITASFMTINNTSGGILIINQPTTGSAIIGFNNNKITFNNSGIYINIGGKQYTLSVNNNGYLRAE